MTPELHTKLFLPSGCLRSETVTAFLEKKLEGTDLSAVRQHLYECPFCLDAVEGLSQPGNSHAVAEIASELNEQISHRLEVKKINAGKRKIAFYLPVAATIILLVGVFSILRSIRQIPTANDTQSSTLQPEYSTESTKSPVAMNMPVHKKLVPPAILEQQEEAGAEKILPGKFSAGKEKKNEAQKEVENPVHSEPVVQPSITETPVQVTEKITSENIAENINKDISGNPQEYPAREVSAGPAGEDLQFFYHVEEMPRFRSGDLTKFRDYVQASLRYPREALREGVEGTVYVSFVVNPDGKVLKPSVVQGISPVLDKEALRVVTSSPDWKPGSHKGNKVSVGFIIPVKFQIEP
jgi:TonB family protein